MNLQRRKEEREKNNETFRKKKGEKYIKGRGLEERVRRNITLQRICSTPAPLPQKEGNKILKEGDNKRKKKC